MIYKLKFLPSALREWKKLSLPLKEQLKKKLKEQLINPRVSASRLHVFKDVYKIKLRSSGYRLVYEVSDTEVSVLVIAVGKRDKGLVYSQAKKRKS
ncbi:MAG: type II toxin-antitoxin system RelE/ParE family toxin [Candidatus Sabulitectum sp.]|nr:type II toxin-antitoxin system RelE/ParE family toxin [Candidatus Sabulitectum sp.]